MEIDFFKGAEKLQMPELEYMMDDWKTLSYLAFTFTWKIQESIPQVMTQLLFQ